MIYRFETFEVNDSTYELRQDGHVQNVEKQVFDLLRLLVASPDRVITKDEIIDAVWGGRAISDAAINSRISTLRSALGDSGREQRLIKTIHNQGLRFVGTVETQSAPLETTTVETRVNAATPPKRKDKRIYPLRPIFTGMGIGAALVGLIFLALPNLELGQTQNSSRWSREIPTQSYPSRDAYLRGVKLREKTNRMALKLAVDQFQLAIDADPEFAPAYAALASVNAQIYDNDPHAHALLKDRIFQSLAQAKALSPKNKDVRVAEGEILALQHEFDQAVSIANAVLADDTGFLPAYLLKGSALYELGRTQEAIEVWGVAMSMDPLSPQILQAMSEAKLAMGDYVGSLEAAEANLWWNPNSTKSLVTMAKIETNNAEYERAFDYLQRARSINPLESTIIYELIELYNNLDMPQERTNVARTNVQQALVQSMLAEKHDTFALMGDLQLEDIHMDIHYLLRDYDIAAQRFNIYLSHRSELKIQPGQGLHYAKFCFVYQHVRQPLQNKICGDLADYYTDMSPHDFSLKADVLGGAAFYLTQGDPERAISWLDHLVQKGHAFMNLTSDPLFFELETVDGYEALQAQMNQNAQVHRAFIRKKLND